MASVFIVGLELSAASVGAILLALALFGGLLVPFLIKEISKGKAQLRRGTPIGAGDVRPGNVGNPAPGQPDGQPDPYSARARR